MGAWDLGLNFAQNENDAVTAQDADIWGIGFNYEWEPKVKGNTPVTLNFSGDVVRFDRDASADGSAVANSGTVAILFTSVEF